MAMEEGFVPTVIAAPAAFVASVMGVTVPALQLQTYAFVASGVIAIACGDPTAMLVEVAFVAVLIGVRVPEPKLLT